MTIGLTEQHESVADVSAIRLVTDDIILPVTTATGTLVFDETSAAEQTLVTLVIAAPSLVGSIWIDMVNVTQNTDILVYQQIDGVNYRCFQTENWLVAGTDGVLIRSFTAYRNVRINLQCGGGGGGNVNVTYAVV